MQSSANQCVASPSPSDHSGQGLMTLAVIQSEARELFLDGEEEGNALLLDCGEQHGAWNYCRRLATNEGSQRTKPTH